MSEATLPLQAAVIAALKAHAPLAAIVGTKVFDRVPAGTAAPYVCLSGWQEIEDGTDCMDASEVFFDVQCFSTAVGRPEAARIAAAVKGVLHRLAPTVTGWGNTEVIYRGIQYFVESDNTTTRAVLNFQALSDSAE